LPDNGSSGSKGGAKLDTIIKSLTELPTTKSSAEMSSYRVVMSLKYKKDSTSDVEDNCKLKITFDWSVLTDGCSADGTLDGIKVSIKRKSGSSLMNLLNRFKSDVGIIIIVST
jgi:hypothetical protein